MHTRDELHRDGFNEEQINEILEGEQNGIDVSKYMNLELLAIQMKEIRLGLEAGLLVDLYAKKEFDWLQMVELRKGLERGVDAKIYAKQNISYDRMREIRKGLEKGYNLTLYKEYEASIIRQVRKALDDNIDIREYVIAGYDKEQLECIREALVNNIEIKGKIAPEFRADAIKEIYRGLSKNLEVEKYAIAEYSWLQMREIRKGLEERLDVDTYCNPNFSWQQMREIRKGLEKGVDVTAYNSLMYTPKEMEKIRKHVWDKVLVTDTSYVHKNHKGIEVTISSDEMEAYVMINKEYQGKYSVEDIEKELLVYGISFGIDLEKFEEALNNPDTFVLVAQGKKPIDGNDGYHEYMFNTDIKRQPKVLADGSVDYSKTEWFECVKEGETIAIYHHASDGMPGENVKGNVLTANKGKEVAVHEMKGCKLLDDKKTYVATTTGKVELKKNKLIVTSMFEIDEVNPSVGHINFIGDVYVKGNVGAGSVINASGDIVVCGFVEGANLRAGGNIEVKLGINASNSGKIEARGNVLTRFFENATVEAGGNVYANNILHSNIKAKGKIIINGSKGSIIGGETYSFEGIEAYNLGNDAKVNTHIRLGVDDELVSKYNRMIMKVSDIKKEIDILESAYKDIQNKYPPEVRNVMDMFIKIETALGTKNKHYNEAVREKDELNKQIKLGRASKAIVTGNVYEGVVFHIDNSTWRSPGVKNVIVEKKIDDRRVEVKYK